VLPNDSVQRRRPVQPERDGAKEFDARLEEPEGRAKPMLYFLAFLLEVWILNDLSTFQTAYLA